MWGELARHNHLHIAPPGGNHEKADAPVNATRQSLLVGGHKVYAAVFEGGMGYRRDNTVSTATVCSPQLSPRCRLTQTVAANRRRPEPRRGLDRRPPRIRPDRQCEAEGGRGWAAVLRDGALRLPRLGMSGPGDCGKGDDLPLQSTVLDTNALLR